MKRIFITISIIAIVGVSLASCSTIVEIATVLNKIISQPQTTPTNETILEVFDSYMQSMSTQKPFKYSVQSFNKTKGDFYPGQSWCIIITPPLIQSANEQQVSHFVVSLNGYEWNGVIFTENRRELWTKLGCTWETAF